MAMAMANCIFSYKLSRDSRMHNQARRIIREVLSEVKQKRQAHLLLRFSRGTIHLRTSYYSKNKRRKKNGGKNMEQRRWNMEHSSSYPMQVYINTVEYNCFVHRSCCAFLCCRFFSSHENYSTRSGIATE